jgi:DNA-binding CsgD family transcriptional regulator
VLTARQRAILELVAQGQPNKEIGRTLGISPETVKSHLEHIDGKLAVERHAKDLALLPRRPASTPPLRSAARSGRRAYPQPSAGPLR